MGVGVVLADVGLLATIGVAGLVGPTSLRRLSDVVGFCLAAATAFALCYDGSLLFAFAGRRLSVNPWVLFIAIAFVASLYASYRTKSLWKGVLAGAWSLVLGTAIWSVGLMAIAYSYWGTHHIRS